MSMSSNEQGGGAILAQVVLAADGAVLGLALAYVAVRSFLGFARSSDALRRIKKAPFVRVSDLRSLLASDSSEKLLVVRGAVDAKSAVDGNWKSFGANVLVSHESGEKGVILQRTQTCIYNEWRGLFFGWTSELRSLLMKSLKGHETTSLRTVPFILFDTNRWPQSDYVIVNMDESGHPLPLTTVYHQLQPVSATPITFLQAAIGHQYPVGLLDEEKILPLGKLVSAVGMCSLNNGIPEIKSCKDLPYFLSDMTKDQMVIELDYRARILFRSALVIGTLSVGILFYAAVRNWNKWKAWRHQRQVWRQTHADNESADPNVLENEESGDVPDGELCVVCLMRRRRSAFIPCGHLVCCQRCALSVEREVTPKCPVCRQAIVNSVRIFDS